MKGITFYNMSKRAEGLELVKKGLKLDLSSHICWHVSALVHKAEKDHEAALAAYSQAVRIDRVRLFCLMASNQSSYFVGG